MAAAAVTGTASLLLSVFVANLLPVFAIAGLGFLLARLGGVQVDTISRVTFRALTPALVFDALVTSTVTGDQFGRMVLFYALVAAAAGLMAAAASSALRLERQRFVAFLLVVVCSNTGNYGLPVAQLAFGREALAFAGVYFVASSIFSYTGGVLLAASGRLSLRQAVAGLARIPAVYGAAAAITAMSLQLHVPAPVMVPIALLSDAALPMMILVLGMQLERTTRPDRPGVVAAAVVISLVLTPLVAIGVAQLVGLRGAAFQAGVLQASMPTAVITTILALEFNVLPNLVTSIVFASTLLSPLTVTIVIAYLQNL